MPVRTISLKPRPAGPDPGEDLGRRDARAPAPHAGDDAERAGHVAAVLDLEKARRETAGRRRSRPLGGSGSKQPSGRVAFLALGMTFQTPELRTRPGSRSARQPVTTIRAPGFVRRIFRMNLRASRSARAVRVQVLTMTSPPRSASGSSASPRFWNSARPVEGFGLVDAAAEIPDGERIHRPHRLFLSFSESASTWAAIFLLCSAKLFPEGGLFQGQDLDGEQGGVGRARLARAHRRDGDALGHLDGRKQRVQPAQSAALDRNADDRPDRVRSDDAGEMRGLAGHGDEYLGAFVFEPADEVQRPLGRAVGRRDFEGERDLEFLEGFERVLDDIEIGFAADENHDVHGPPPVRSLMRPCRCRGGNASPRNGSRPTAP